VRVLVLLVQTTEAFAIVSQEPRIQTRSFLAVICFMAKASARVTASRRPSRTATTTSVTEMVKIRVKVMPFSLAVLWKQVRAKIEVERGKTLTEQVLQYPAGQRSGS